MVTRKIVIVLLCLLYGSVSLAAGQTEVDGLRKELLEIKRSYEDRIRSLEERIQSLEQAPPAPAAVASVVPEVPVTQEKPSDFNPSISAVLVGTAGYFSRDPNHVGVPGFMLGDESGPGEDGFSLGETEINMNANIDDKFYANLTLAVADDNGSTEVELEESWFETMALPYDLTLRGGRFFSDIGYRNQFHRHADDFVDRPLVYRTFLNGQYLDDGVQLRWLAPTDMYMELGAEWLRGEKFPAGGSAHDGKGVWSLSGRIGGDVGFSNSWLAGLSWTSARARNRHSGEGDRFSGDVDLAILDGVWKWAPDGNSFRRNLKLEGALFWQNQDGRYTPDEEASLSYDEDQWGGYLEGTYQFIPQWRAGLRYSWVDADSPGSAFDDTALDTMGVSPKIYTAMLDWSNSEFSRVRLQYSRDESDIKSVDRIYLQYILSMGAHGAHQF